MKQKSDFPEELLSGYLDGELSAAEMSHIEAALAEDVEVRRSFEELAAVNSQVARYVRGNIPEGPLNLWAEIEKKITPRATAARSVKRASFAEAFASFFSQPAGLAVAGAFGVAMFAFGILTSRLSAPATELAKKQEILVPIVGDTRQLSGDVRFVSRQNPVVAGFSPRFVAPHTLNEDHPARNAGYSTESVEIDWMKCPKSVRLVRSDKDRDLPPVLWIGQ